MLRWLITLALLVTLVRNIDLRKVLEIVGAANLPIFLAALCTALVQALLAAIRWWLILSRQEINVAPARILKYSWLGLFFNQILPSSVGGDAVRAYCLAKEGISLSGASLTIVLDRLFGLYALVFLVIVTLPLTVSYLHDTSARVALYILIAAAMLVLSLILAASRMLAAFQRWRIARALITLSASAKEEMLSINPGIGFLSLSMIIHILSISVVALLARAISLDVNWVALLIVVPVAILFMTVPISIGGWGVREGVVIVGLSYAGIPSEHALVLSILFGFSLLLTALPGGFFWGSVGKNWSKSN